MNQRWLVGSIAAVLLLLTAAWAFGWFAGDYSDDPQVAELEKLRDEALEQPREERAAYKDQFQERMKDMNEDQRKAFIERSMPIFVKMGAAMMEQRFDEFFAKSPDEQRRLLDEKIDQQLAREKKGGRQGSGRRGGPPNMSGDKAAEMMKKMNDWTTPEQRAKFETMMGMYNQRREERGLAPVGPGRWR